MNTLHSRIVLWTLLGAVALLGCTAFWSIRYTDISQKMPVTLLQMEGDVTAPGINLHDGRTLTFNADLPAGVNWVGLRTSKLNQAEEGVLEIAVVDRSRNEVVGRGEVEVAELRSDVNHWIRFDEPFKGGGYTVRLHTRDVSSDNSFQIPVSVPRQSTGNQFQVYEAQEDETETLIAERPGSVWVEFASFQSVDMRVQQAVRESLIPFMGILLVVLVYGVLLQRKVQDAGVREGDGVSISWKEWLIFCLLGIGVSIAVTASIYSPLDSVSSHGDINRGLIFFDAVKEQVLAGRVPLWQPYMCGGAPLWGDIEQWQFQPLALLLLPFSAPIALKLAYTATLAISFIGFAVLGRTIFKLNMAAAIAFAFLGAFSAYLTQHLAEGYFVWIGMAWMPWFVLFTVKSFTRPVFIPVAALMAVWIFGSGTMHLVFYSTLFLGIISFIISIRKKTVIPLAALALILVFAAVIGSFKLLPVLSLTDVETSRPGLVPSLSLLPDMLLARQQLPPLEQNRILYRWSEFGNYIGVIPLLLAITGGILMWRHRKSLPDTAIYIGTVAASLLILALVFTPLPVTSGLLATVTELLRMPSRLMIFPVIGIALLVGYAVHVFWEHFQLPSKERISRFIFISILVVAAADLTAYNFQRFSTKLTLPIPPISPSEEFRRVANSYTMQDGSDEYYKVGYISYLQNQGTNDLCRYYQAAPETRAVNGSNPFKIYRDEVWLADERGTYEYILEPGRIVVKAVLDAEDRIVINQNYYPGWQGTGNVLVESFNGLISVPLSEGTHEFVLEYKPPIIWWAGLVSAVGMVVAVAWYVLFRRFITAVKE